MTVSNFSYYILPILIGWLKTLKNPLEEDSPIVAPEINHYLFTNSDFIFRLCLPILKVL